jgi:hypothetical protein
LAVFLGGIGTLADDALSRSDRVVAALRSFSAKKIYIE